MSASEEAFMFKNVEDELHFNAQVEGAHALAWSLNFVASLDFDDYCADDLVKLIPDLKVGESSASFRARAKLRGLDEIVSACDLAYCLDWAVVEASLGNKELPGPIGPYVITQRRRALEWMLAAEDWDEVSLDT
ncbi:MAG: DUF4272 domain-containing protein [Alphaproteobacteria bacterium]|nr:DUF4272 domain-containing protein [Alphaproteobacteria bacterium]